MKQYTAVFVWFLTFASAFIFLTIFLLNADLTFDLIYLDDIASWKFLSMVQT